MKAQVLAGLLAAAMVQAVGAQDQPAEAGLSTLAAGGTDAQTTAGSSEVQYRTYTAGHRLLIDISSQVGDDLNARLEREISGDVPARPQQHELLVSSNLQQAF